MIIIILIVSVVGYFWLKSAFEVFDRGANNDNKEDFDDESYN